MIDGSLDGDVLSGKDQGHMRGQPAVLRIMPFADSLDPLRVHRRKAREGNDVERHGPYCAVQPPSLLIGTPVIWSAEDEQRNTARPPICSGVENSFDGVFSATRSSFSSS